MSVAVILYEFDTVRFELPAPHPLSKIKLNKPPNSPLADRAENRGCIGLHPAVREGTVNSFGLVTTALVNAHK